MVCLSIELFEQLDSDDESHIFGASDLWYRRSLDDQNALFSYY